MNYKGIRAISFLSGLLTVLLFVTWAWLRLSADTLEIQTGTSIALRASSAAFFFIALLAANVASVLETQADDIAALKRDRVEQR